MKNSFAGFFDYASATPVDPVVSDYMAPYFSDNFFNPSALYSSEIKADLENARRDVAAILGVKPREIVFTAGCTEANNIALQGVMDRFPEGKLLISAIEHDSVQGALERYNGAEIPVHPDGLIDINALRELVSDDVVLISIIYANNEIGTIQNLREISAVLDEERNNRGSGGLPLYLHTDAAQAANYCSIKARSLGVQLMSLNGGKIYGPKASGCLFVGNEVELSPLYFGGNQESGMRSGTENIPSILGFAKSLEISQADMRQEVSRLCELQSGLYRICESYGGVIVGSRKHRLPNNVNVRFDQVDNETLVMRLAEMGIQAAIGSACHAASGAKSHVLASIGLTDQEAQHCIRLTIGRYTTPESLSQLDRALRVILA